MINIYGIKNCGSVKKAISFFKEYNLDYELHDFKINNVSCEKVSYWLEFVEMKTLFNKRSTTYKTEKLKDLNLDYEGQKNWLCKKNLLIKRPVLEFNNQVLVGFNEEIYKETFL